MVRGNILSSIQGQQMSEVGVSDQALVPDAVMGHLNRNASVLGVIAEHTHAAALGELAALVVEVLSDADALHHGPGLPRPQQGCWEDDSVEGHIVLAHELDQIHIVRILPPRLHVDRQVKTSCMWQMTSNFTLEACD